MTLVPSHQPLLSGSKLISLALIAFLFFSSCDPSKRGHRTNYPSKPRPEAGQHPKPKKDKDVVVTTKTDTIPKKPTETLPDPSKGIPSAGPVRVALVLPFATNKFSETSSNINPKSMIAIQFYAGLKLALQEASYDDVSIDLSVLDSKASYNETVALQSNSALVNADIIVGPYRKKNALLTAETAVRKGQVMFSPFSMIPPTTLAGKGTVIQTFAGLDTYMQAIIDHLTTTGAITQTIILTRQSGKDNRAAISLQKAASQAHVGPLAEIKVDDRQLSFEDLDLKSLLANKPNTVFIVPAWKSSDYIGSIVRKIYVSRAEDEVPTIVGMPQWLSFKNLDFQKLNSLHTLIPTADVVSQNAQTKKFAQTYFNTYQDLAGKNAYKGYDFGKYLVQFIQANKDGTLHVPAGKNAFFDYEFTEVYNQANDQLKNNPVIYKNKTVKLMRLVNYQLVD